MEQEEVRKLIKINSKYALKESRGILRMATVDTLTDLPDGVTEITYHYNNERNSMWFLTAEEFLDKFICE